jgi:putative Holliday junction resolvase
MRALGVDLGRRRIGLAISDVEGAFAFPLDAVASAGRTRDVKALAQVIALREIDRVVVGLPLHMDGRAGPEAEEARAFATALAKATGVPVDTLDERWTSIEAERALVATGTRRTRRDSRKSGELDSMAATIILRTWLERTSGSDTREPPR